MLLNRIEIVGYKRLVNASAYVGRKAIALVGPNEAGKSSVLSALMLVNDAGPVPPSSYSRVLRAVPRKDDGDVVRLSFSLTDEQKDRLKGLPLEVVPDYYVEHKKVNGERRFSLKPVPRVDPQVATSVVAAMQRLEHLLMERTSFVREEMSPEQEQLFQDLKTVQAELTDSRPSDESHWDRLREVYELDDEANPPADESLRAFELAYQWARRGARLQELVRDELDVTIPEFVLFDPVGQGISARYNLDDPASDASEGLQNLLSIAQVSLNQIRESRSELAFQRELLDRATGQLESFFASRWSQERVSVGLYVDGSSLDVQVRDVGGDAITGWLAMDERSDGLRTFVAMSAFLAQKSDATSPILLIDEAEQHLHLNAQADLIQMLVRLPQIEQVIYTTHSPGCLPPDIGNGVRFVEPRADGTSSIRHDFWHLDSRGSHVGFNPLLFAMGAGAAAFSALRYAVFVEGASDMLLLPSLIRLATGEPDLRYQVAPGIASAGGSELDQMTSSAGRVLFLVDGDKAGKKWARELRASGVPPERIYSLPTGIALEDLLERNFYLDLIASSIGLDSENFPGLDETTPVKTALTAWAKGRNVQIPGAVAVAEKILGQDESGENTMILSDVGQDELTALHKWASKTFLD